MCLGDRSKVLGSHQIGKNQGNRGQKVFQVRKRRLRSDASLWKSVSDQLIQLIWKLPMVVTYDAFVTYEIMMKAAGARRQLIRWKRRSRGDPQLADSLSWRRSIRPFLSCALENLGS